MAGHDFETHCRSLIHNEVRAYIQRGGTIKDLAEEAKLNKRTVSQLAYRETKYPRFTTVHSTLQALGYTFTIQKL